MAKTTRRFIPRLEVFDERCLPSVTGLFGGGSTIQVQCDDAADNILVTESAGVLEIYDNGNLVFSGSGMTLVEVFTAGGDDTVNYQVSGPLTHSQSFSARLGLGNDTFNANLDGVNVGPGPGVDLIVQAYGEAGRDTFNVSAVNTHVDANASLIVDLIGGKGKATYNVDYSTVTVDPSGMFSHSETRR